jgi:S1-C subfamily serine protease
VVQPYTPAFSAGLHSDDKSFGINDVRTTDNEKLRELIRKSNGEEITVVVQRGSASAAFADDSRSLKNRKKPMAPKSARRSSALCS